MHHGLGSDIAARTRPVLDYEGLAKSLLQPLPHQTRDDVGSTAGSKPNNPTHRSRRIIKRQRDAQHDWERGSARSQVQKISAGKFHFEPPSRFTSLDHLVGEQLHRVGHFEAEQSRCLRVDDELEFGRLHDRKIGGVRTF
jgi:hypothetical protein